MARGTGRPISCRYLSEEERIRIADLRREKRSIRSIAAELGSSPSTISREIRRNCKAFGRATRATTAPLLLTSAPRHGVLAPSLGGSRRALSCGTSSRRAWTRSGALSRARTSCAGSFRAARRCM
ncbi:helix-turn-helix domain-containing protein [Streptomyces niveus]|uniref:Helix-turn-helix domain-containing protein n=1 Tax=Streptomyces niveus TaxID=193462 RepID=A0ABZ2AEV0_STRNV